jgi:hypothetical protein
MKAILRTSAFCVVACVASLAFGQDSDEAADANTASEMPPVLEPPPTIKGRGKRLPRKSSGTGVQSKNSFLFPDWPAPKFAFSASPVVGFQYKENSVSDVSVFMAEAGIRLGVQGIPLHAGNPGLYVEPYAGYAIGQTFVTQKVGDTRTGTYHRPWGGIRVPLLLKFYRHTLDVNYSQIKGELLDTRRVFGVVSDSGFLILPFFSGHYTMSYEKSAAQSMDDVLSTTYDQWFHAHFFTHFLNAYLDLGPGVTFRKTYREPDLPSTSILAVEGNSTTTYAKAVGGFDIVPNFVGAELQSKYVLSSQTEGTVTYDSARSPAEYLGAAERKLGLPDDYLYASAFLGLKNVIGNISFGWRYNVDVANAMERNGVRNTQTSTGFGVHYSSRM